MQPFTKGCNSLSDSTETDVCFNLTRVTSCDCRHSSHYLFGPVILVNKPEMANPAADPQPVEDVQGDNRWMDLVIALYRTKCFVHTQNLKRCIILVAKGK